MSLRLYGPNMLYNGDLERGSTSSWGMFYNTASGALGALSVSTAAPYRGAYEMYIDVKSFGAGTGDVQVYQQNIAVMKSVRTSLMFAGRAEVDRWLRVNYLLGQNPWSLYFYDYSALTTSYQMFEHTFTVDSDVNSGSIRFYCGSGGVTPEDSYLDDINLRAYIDLPAQYDYRAGEVLDRRDARALHGALTTYIEPTGFRRFTIPLTHVTSLERSLINSWWSSGSELRFVEDNTYPFSFTAVRLVGDNTPVTKVVQPYADQYSGEIVLETV